MTTAKNDVFIGFQLENCYLVEGIKIWWVGDEQIFGCWGIQCRENPAI